ncbi:DNA-directed RNA polymerase subunit beta [Paenibacillus tarimensis]
MSMEGQERLQNRMMAGHEDQPAGGRSKGDAVTRPRAEAKDEASRKRSSDKEQAAGYKRPAALRVLLWILRKSIVPLLLLLALIAGLYAGFVVLGNGPESEVWDWKTWRHMYDLIFAES